jgi:uncharacterized protein YbaP (TraB family)
MNDDDIPDDFDPMNEVDREVWELQEAIRLQNAEIVRLEAMVDQIAAASAENAAEIARLHDRMDELDARYKRLSRIIWLRGALMAGIGVTIGQIISYLIF